MTQFEYDIGASGVAGNLNGNIIEGRQSSSKGRVAAPIHCRRWKRRSHAGCSPRRANNWAITHSRSRPGILSQAYKDPLGNHALRLPVLRLLHPLRL